MENDKKIRKRIFMKALSTVKAGLSVSILPG